MKLFSSALVLLFILISFALVAQNIDKMSMLN